MNENAMTPALHLHQIQFARLRRSRSLDSGLSSSSSSSSRHWERMELPPNEGSTNREETTLSPVRSRHSKSKSSDDGRRSPDIHPEFLQVLKRRSLPHAPSRSSSLTLPPELPSDDDSVASRPPSRKRGPDEEFPPRPRRWRELWTSMFSRWRPSPPPPPATRNENAPPDGGNHNVVVVEEEDVALLGNLLDDDKENIHPSEAREMSNHLRTLEVTQLPRKKATSSRYFSPLSFLWIYRQMPRWRPDVHPLVYGFRFFNDWGGHEHDTLLDIGCEVLGGPSLFGLRLGKPFPEQEDEDEEDMPDDEERGRALNSSSHSGSRAGPDEASILSYIEDARLPANPDEWEGIPIVEGIDPNASNYEPTLEPVSNSSRSPRPARRSLSLESNTLLRIQRLNETISRSRTQEFAEAALLLGLTIERKFGRIAEDAAETTPDTSMADVTEVEGGEGMSNTTGASVDVVEVVEEGDHTISDAVGGSVQEEPLPDGV